MKRKLFLLLCALLTMIGVQAQTDVTASYIGNLDQAAGKNGDPYGHAESNGNGWWNSQTTGLTGWHAFTKNGTAFESWTGSFGGAGAMIGRTMVLPVGNYTLSFEAFGCNATNSAEPGTLPSAGDVVAFLTGKDNVDITNTAAAGDATFHNVSFTFDVTTANTAYEFGIKKLADGSKIDWCQIRNVKLTLNSTDIFAVVNNSVDPFVYSGSQTWHTNTWSTEGQGDGSRFQVPFHELWVAKGGKLADATIKGTYTPAESGVYKVSAWVRAVNESGGAISGAQIFVGDTKADACSGSPVMSNKGRLGTFTAMADGVAGTPFEYGFELKSAEINWLAFKNVTITYLGDLPQSEIDALLSQVPTGKMNASVKSTLDGYVSALNTEKSVASYNTLSLYLPTAQASANVYVTINDAINAYATKAASLDAAGQAAYDASNVTTKYNNGTYETLAEAKTDLWSAFALATKAQTTEGSDWTGILINPGFEDNAAGYEEPIGWTLAGTANGIQTQNNSGFDGYRVGTMFGERWSNSTIGDFDAYQTIEGMPSGVYELKAVATFNGTGGYLYANDIKTNVTEAKYYTVQVALDANSTLRVGVKNETSGNGSWFKCDDFTLTLVSAGLPDVTPVVGKMNAEVADAQTTAIETYEANRTVANYNAASAAIAAAQASVDAYAAANAAIVKAEGIIAETNVFVAADKTVYQNAINTAKSAYNAGSMEDATATSLENNLNGGTAYKHEGDPMRPFYSGAWSATNEVSIYTNNWSNEGDTDGSNFTTPFIEDWVSDANSLANTTISASVTNLLTGTYNVTARVRMRLKNNVEAPVNGLSLQASSGEPVAVSGTPNYGSFYVAEVAATGYVTEEGGSLGINFIVNNTNASWLSIKAVNYERTGDLPAADAADYAALKDALDAVAGNVVGFEAGEYAPYNNKEAVAALNVAKAIDPTVINVKFAVQAATAALTDATWTANAEELNAFYKGDFADYAEDTSTPLDYTPNGWTATNNFRLMLKNVETYPGLADASAGTAPMSWSGGITYGETAGYEMPLKANTIYRLQFKAAGWNNETRSGMSVSILNGTDGMALYNLGTPDRDIKGNATNVAGMTPYEVVFATGAAGNYVFHVHSGNNFVITDFNLVKAASQTLTITDGEALPKFAPGTYPSATYSRTLPTGNKWGTICLPFNLKSDENIQFYTVSSIGSGVLNVETVTEVAAGVPAIFKKLAPEATISVTTNEATVVAAPAEAENGENAKLVGTFMGTTIEGESVGNYYYIKNDQFWRGNGNFSIPAYRAYIEDLSATNPGARLVINVDGEDPTAINVIEAAEAEDGALKDGKYLIDGKVIIVKNGVKYGANGQKLN